MKYPEDYIHTDLCNLEPKDQFKKAINLLLDNCTDNDSSKIEIRVFRKNKNDETHFLHSKCYIFDGFDEGEGYGIIGSSNFTEKGLTDNAELNHLETEVNLILGRTPVPNHKTYYLWFKEMWETSEPWNKTFLEQVLKPTPIVDTATKEKPGNAFKMTPYEVYIKYLQTYFGDLTDQSVTAQIRNYLPKNLTAMLDTKCQIISPSLHQAA